MATKKNAIVKSQKIDDMIAAGIEVKLTKMEIADYIAAKAKEELNKRLKVIESELQSYAHGKVPFADYVTSKQKKFIEMYNEIHGTNHDVKNATLMSIWGRGVVISFPIAFDPHNPLSVFQNMNGLNIPLDSEQRNLDVVISEKMLNEENQELMRRISELDKKQHRTLLVEQILSGSDSGKKVLADLNSMVSRAVKGDG